MWPTIAALLSLLISIIAYYILKLIRLRHELDGLPQPPMRNVLLGHILIAAEINQFFPPNVHSHTWPAYLQQKYKLGNVFYLDLRPLGPKMLFLADPELSSQHCTTGQSLKKSSLETDFIVAFLGDRNMVTLEGAEWKALRSIFNPGFATSHLMTLSSYIVDASLEFCQIIRDKAKTNELIELEEYTTRLTIDIIGKVVLDSNLNSQRQMHPIVTTFRKMALLMPPPNAIQWDKLNFVRPLRLWWNTRKLDRLIGDELDVELASRLAEQRSGSSKSSKNRKRSVIDLALDAYEKETKQTAEKGSSTTPASTLMSTSFRRQAIDSIKTFIFAGHDTTSSTIAYVLYLLHLHPQSHQKAVTELNEIFGVDSSTQEIAAAIKSDPYVINKLEYITAIIKEVLRIFPPASTLRWTDEPGLFMTDPATGLKYPYSRCHIWPPPHLIGRNEAFFPSPELFIPERFIPTQTPFPDSKLFTPAGKDAWRPFEKGPRNCIGQELAMMESKIIVAMVIKDFDFVAEYDGVKIDKWTPRTLADEIKEGKSGVERMTVEGHRCFQVLKGSAKPCEGMPGRVYLRH